MSELILKLEDEGAPPYVSKVVEILNSTLSPNGPTSPNDAALSIDALFLKDYKEKGTAGSFLWWFWDLIHDLARQVPSSSTEQDRLAGVIKALHDLPTKTVSLGEEWGEDDSTGLWARLPMFGNTLYEKFSNGDHNAAGETERKERAVNLNSYAARVAGQCQLPFQMYAIWALVDALEGTLTPVRGAPDQVNEDPKSVEDFSYKLESAAGRDEEVHGATAGPLWTLSKAEALKSRSKCKGTNGLSLKRWQLWKERFKSIQDNDGVDEKDKEEAGGAYAAMEKIEGEQQPNS